MLACAIGAACHSAHSRHLVGHLIENSGRRFPLDCRRIKHKSWSANHTPCYRSKTWKLSAILKMFLILCWRTNHPSSRSWTHRSRRSQLRLKSKAFHVGMMTTLGWKSEDIAQISTLRFIQKLKLTHLLWKLGIGSVDRAKPLIMVIRTQCCSINRIIDYAKGKTKRNEK